jgi:putative phosphoesterase
MKLAVLADIHANLPALEAVSAHLEAWRPDHVIVAGDIINRGPRPYACLDFVQHKQRTAGWRTVRGNHEDYVINQVNPCSQIQRELQRFTYWTYERLGGCIEPLQAMPFQQSLTAPDKSEIRVVHASMLGNRIGIFPKMSDEQVRERIPPPAKLFCIGHTHWPLIRRIDQTLVVNVGAVGLPFDRDTRAAYAQLTWRDSGWQAEIIRLDYDRDRAEQDFYETGFLEEGGPAARIILDELHTARSHLYSWTHRFQTPILAGEITIGQAVDQYLAELS